MTVIRSPDRPRGRRPFVFALPEDTDQARQYFGSIPGVRVGARHIHATAGGPARAVARTAPLVHRPPRADRRELFTGYGRASDLGLLKKMRPYQLDTLKKHGTADAFYVGYDMRLGKSAYFMTAATIRGARNMLVFCPGFIKPVWLAEARKWLGIDALVLDGRGGDRAYYAREESRKRKWIKGRPEVLTAIREFPMVVLNYDILQAQAEKDAAGKVHFRQDLLGWAPFLAGESFDAVALDEGHEVSGWKAGKSGVTRADLIHHIIRDAERCPLTYILSGTPAVAQWQYWAQYRMLFGSDSKGRDIYGSKPWAFMARYCDGRHETTSWKGAGGETVSRKVWVYDGVTNMDEWKATQAAFQQNLKRRDVSDQMPVITRVATEIDLPQGRKKLPTPPKTGTFKKREQAYAQRSLRAKWPGIWLNVQASLRAGAKVGIFTRWIASYEYVKGQLQKELAKRDMKKTETYLGAFYGGTPHDSRFGMAAAFRACEGPAILLANMDALAGGISLAGLTENHFVELHTRPDRIQQVEARGAELGERGITSHYYLLPGSYDDRLVEILLPKLEAMDQMSGDVDAVALAGQLRKEVELDALAAMNAIASGGSLADLRDVEIDAD